MLISIFVHINQAIGEDPDDAVQWHQIGLHCLCTQQLKMSQTYLKSAVARLNDCVYTWSNLGNHDFYLFASIKLFV